MARAARRRRLTRTGFWPPDDVVRAEAKGADVRSLASKLADLKEENAFAAATGAAAGRAGRKGTHWRPRTAARRRTTRSFRKSASSAAASAGRRDFCFSTAAPAAARSGDAVANAQPESAVSRPSKASKASKDTFNYTGGNENTSPPARLCRRLQQAIDSLKKVRPVDVRGPDVRRETASSRCSWRRLGTWRRARSSRTSSRRSRRASRKRRRRFWSRRTTTRAPRSPNNARRSRSSPIACRRSWRRKTEPADAPQPGGGADQGNQRVHGAEHVGVPEGNHACSGPSCRPRRRSGCGASRGSSGGGGGGAGRRRAGRARPKNLRASKAGLARGSRGRGDEPVVRRAEKRRGATRGAARARAPARQVGERRDLTGRVVRAIGVATSLSVSTRRGS